MRTRTTKINRHVVGFPSLSLPPLSSVTLCGQRSFLFWEISCLGIAYQAILGFTLSLIDCLDFFDIFRRIIEPNDKLLIPHFCQIPQ